MKSENRIVIRRLILTILLGILVLSVAQMINAETEIYQVNKNVELKFTCTLNNAIPTSANLNVTISYPNGSTYSNNVATTALGNGLFKYNTNFSVLGIYPVTTFCWDGTYSNSNPNDNYEITNTGFKLDTSKSIVLLIGLCIMLLIGILLFYFGIKSEGIIKLFSLCLSILLVSFSFGYTINILSAGIGEYTGLINSFDSLYFLITVLLSVGGMGLVIFLVYEGVQYFNKTRGFKD
jgi:hypothetical protein